MKKSKYAWLAAALLTTATGFTACSSDDTADDTTTTAGESVKTQFSISLTDKAGKTRLTESQVQAKNVFLGMTDIHMYPFGELSFSGNAPYYPVASTNTSKSSYIQLEEFGQFDNTTDNKKVYTNVDIPLGTNAFLFYGKAIDDTKTTGAYVSNTLASTSASDLKDNWPSGTSVSASSIYFMHEPYVAAGLTTNDIKTLDALKAFWTVISGISKTSDDWTARVNAFSTLRSGSSENVLAAIQLFCDKSASDEDFVKALFKDGTNTPVELGTTNKMKFTYKTGSPASITCAWSDGDFTFPTTDSHLPNGSIVLNYDKTEGFQLATTSASGMLTTSIPNFVKPVPLYYFANSPAMTETNIHFTGSSADYLSENWDWVIGTTNATSATNQTESTPYKRAAVAGSTRSVIIENKIQYGVGMLNYNVKVSDGTLKDNGNNDVKVVSNNAGKLQLKGILIGGQMPVDYNFNPITGTTGTPSTYQKTIYDYTLNGDAPSLTTDKCTDQYTMAFETPSYEKNQNKSKIKVALEFVNNTGDAFEGYAGNIIPNSSTFYLLAELDPSQGKMKDGTTPTIDQVFKQDYKTTVTFTISSLKDAYNFIPNLDATSLEFGMAVDLSWTEGLTFDVVIK